MKIVARALFICTAAVVALFPATRNVHGAARGPADQRAGQDRGGIRAEYHRQHGRADPGGEGEDLVRHHHGPGRAGARDENGLVAYRDRGDAYVTRVVDVSADLAMYATLMDFEANGGGDGPESVNQALYEAVHNVY